MKVKTRGTLLILVGLALSAVGGLMVCEGIVRLTESMEQKRLRQVVPSLHHPDPRLEMHDYHTPKNCLILEDERFALCPDAFRVKPGIRFSAAHKIYLNCMACWIDGDSKACLGCSWSTDSI